MGAEVSQLRATGFSFGGFNWKPDLRVAHIQRVEKRFMMDERSIIDVEGDFADQRQRVLPVPIIENPYVSRDQTAERVQR